MPGENTKVFVSYSHADATLVAPVVKLLRINKALVFQDIDGIQPGKRWQKEIAKALAESHLVVVFWCDHASRSDEVSKEWKAALQQEKDLLPLLLDTTPLPSELAEFQWIDFREMVGANHSSIDSSDSAPQVSAPAPRPAPAARSGRWLLAGGLATVFALAVIVSLFTLKGQSIPDPTLHPAPMPAPGIFDFVGTKLFLLTAAIAVTVWLLRRRAKRATPADSAHPGAVERQIASELEAEILRRTASRR